VILFLQIPTRATHQIYGISVSFENFCMLHDYIAEEVQKPWASKLTYKRNA